MNKKVILRGQFVAKSTTQKIQVINKISQAIAKISSQEKSDTSNLAAYAKARKSK